MQRDFVKIAKEGGELEDADKSKINNLIDLLESI